MAGSLPNPLWKSGFLTHCLTARVPLPVWLVNKWAPPIPRSWWEFLQRKAGWHSEKVSDAFLLGDPRGPGREYALPRRPSQAASPRKNRALYVIAGPHGSVAREPVNLPSTVEEQRSTGSAGERCFLPKVLRTDALSQGSMASVRCEYLSTTYLLDGISVQVINQYPELLGDVHGFLQLAPIIFSLELHQSLKRNKKHDQKAHQWSFHQAGFRRAQGIGTQTHGRREAFWCP